MTTSYPHHGGMQHPGMPHGQPMGSGPGSNPSQPIMEPAMQMHPGVSGPKAMYKKIAVLLIKWADELDELKTRDEVLELENVFHDLFHYETKVVELNVSRKPQHQVHTHLSDFVYTYDGPYNLLIIYYTGHAVYSGKNYLEMCASANIEEGGLLHKAARWDWNKAEEILRDDDVECDVLTILDIEIRSNWAGNKAVSTDPLTSRAGDKAAGIDFLTSWVSDVVGERAYEILSTCAFESITANPGLNTFTRALVKALKELVVEMGFFTTFHLNERIILNRNKPSLHSGRLRNYDQHIWLAPLELDGYGRNKSIRFSVAALAVYAIARWKKKFMDRRREDCDTSLQTRSPVPHSPYASQGVVENNEFSADSDAASNFSESASLWSDGFTEDSQSSFGDVHVVSQKASAKMAEMLWENPDLRPLYSEVMTKFEKDRFTKDHDYIMKKFFEDLRSEVDGNLQLRTLRLLRHRAQRLQVTEWIYKLCSPSIDPAVLDARQKFLDQKENRAEVLNRFLQSQATKGKQIERHDDFEAYEHRDVESSEESEDEVKDEDKLPESEELKSIVTFLTQGQSFEIFKANLRALVLPDTSIHEALKYSDACILRYLLLKHFNRVAIGEYSWIKELDEAGYSHEEISHLLFEEANDAPWIYFEPQALHRPVVCPKAKAHIPGCVHRYLDDAALENRAPTSLIDFNAEKDIHVTNEIQELCGLGGIAPTSRDHEAWNGSVTFEQQNSVAFLSYDSVEGSSDDIHLAIVHRIITALERFCSAAARVQSAGLCCNAFTVLSKNFEGLSKPVELCRIDFISAIQLLAETRVLTTLDPLTASDFENAQQVAMRILRPVEKTPIANHRYDVSEILHKLALAAQFLCLGFLSYLQAHIGAIQPFFLDAPLRTVYLQGSQGHECQQDGIIAELTELTCMGNMIGSPVLTFSITRPSTKSPSLENQERFDLIATAEDLLDTWGPGNFVVQKSLGVAQEKPGSHPRYPDSFQIDLAPAQKSWLPQEILGSSRQLSALPKNNRVALLCAIQICGGIISAQDGNASKFHWSPGMVIEGIKPVFFDQRHKIQIGALVTVNESCNIDEKESWDKSSSAFENLGVHDDFWRHDESQVGGQAGQYVLLQHNRIKRKIPGKTLKQLTLEQHSDMLIQVLNCLWGLQVSFCTGVTRRVPLRELIADLLPVFARTFKEQGLWDELRNQHKIFDAFQTDAVQDWLRTLPSHLYNHLLSIIRRMLVVLQPTGLNPEGKSLLVAWPYNCPPFRCFRIPCYDKMSSWVRILADDGDCACFAYISTNCLETPSIKCRGPSPLWHNTMPLLETAVIRHNEKPSQPVGPLEHKKTYFFKKLDSLLQVTVEKEVTSGMVNLYVSPSLIPPKFMQRVYRMEMRRSEGRRIRERQKQGELGAERVAVLTKCEKV